MDLLTVSEKNNVSSALSGYEIMAQAVAKLYLAFPNPNAWSYSNIVGVVSLVRKINSFAFKIVDPEKKEIIWEYDIDSNMTYEQNEDYLHVFPYKTIKCMAGFSFTNESEGRDFYNCVIYRNMSTKISPVSSRIGSPKLPTATPPVTTTIKIDKKNKDEKKKHKKDKDKKEKKNKKGIFSFGSSSKSKSKSGKKGKKGGIDKSLIGKPTNFRHEQYIGYDPEKGFVTQNASPEWQEIFKKAGITPEVLADEKSRKIVNKFIKKHDSYISKPPALPAVPVKKEKRPPPPPPPPKKRPPPPPPPQKKSTQARKAPPPPPPAHRKNKKAPPPPPPTRKPVKKTSVPPPPPASRPAPVTASIPPPPFRPAAPAAASIPAPPPPPPVRPTAPAATSVPAPPPPPPVRPTAPTAPAATSVPAPPPPPPVRPAAPAATSVPAPPPPPPVRPTAPAATSVPAPPPPPPVRPAAPSATGVPPPPPPPPAPSTGNAKSDLLASIRNAGGISSLKHVDESQKRDASGLIAAGSSAGPRPLPAAPSSSGAQVGMSNDLLASIRNAGIGSLKHVDKSEIRDASSVKPTAESADNTNDLAAALAQALQLRNDAFGSDDDSDSDSDDSDSDSSEWSE